MLRILIIFCLVLILSACQKAGTGGSARLNVFVLRAEEKSLVQGMKVRIRYNETEFPGRDSDLYNDFAKTDHHGKCNFSGLRKGNYFLYTEGLDSILLDSISGSSTFHINNKTGERDVIIYVSPMN